MATRQRQRDAECFPPGPQRRERPGSVSAGDLHGAVVDALVQAVATRWTVDAARNSSGESIVPAHYGHAVERQTPDEFDERIEQALEILFVGVQVVPVDVRDDRHDRCEMQERRVGLVGFGDQVHSRPQSGVAAVIGQRRPDDVGGVQSGGLEHPRHQTSRRGLAMGSRDGDALALAHQLTEHLGARHHRNAQPVRGGDFHVVVRHCARHDDHIRTRNRFGIVAMANRRAARRQPRRCSRPPEVRTGNRVALTDQQLGDTGHPGAADANEVDSAGRRASRIRRDGVQARASAELLVGGEELSSEPYRAYVSSRDGEGAAVRFGTALRTGFTAGRRRS